MFEGVPATLTGGDRRMGIRSSMIHGDLRIDR
jgi:hypothetical protein